MDEKWFASFRRSSPKNQGAQRFMEMQKFTRFIETLEPLASRILGPCLFIFPRLPFAESELTP